MSIILIRGYSHSGKDFVGSILCKQYGYQRFAFADSLKQIVSELYDVPIDVLHSQEGKRLICEKDSLKRSYRQILIDEALRLRKIDDDYFVKACCKTIKDSSIHKIVITDWRYPNELNMLQDYFKDYQIKTVHIIRPLQEISPVMDVSEYKLKERKNDYVIYNHMDNGIYEDIKKLIESLSSPLSL